MNPTREEALFASALERPAGERAAFLDGACLGDAVLRQRVETLVAAYDATANPLHTAAGPAATLKVEFADAPDEAVGQTLGRYKLLDPEFVGGALPVDSVNAVQSMGVLPGRNELAYTALDENVQRMKVEGARTLHFLDPATREIVRSMPLVEPGERSTTYISNLRFSPDGSRLAAANHEGRRINLYDVASGRRLYSLPDETSVIWWLAWHPDGRRLAITRDNGDISIWNLTEVEAALVEAGLAP